MNGDMLVTLRGLDRAVLNAVVQQDQRSPTFEVLEWTVEPIRFAKINFVTDGLFRFSGRGEDARGVRPWSVVLKIVNKPKDGMGNPRSVFYWKRELLAFQSGILEDIPDAVRVPCCYGVMERDDGGWLWIEHIHESTERRWSLEHFGRAAFQFGRFGGAYLTGRPLPEQPWLAQPIFRDQMGSGSWWNTFMNPESAHNVWQDKLVQKTFTEPLRSEILQIHAEAEQMIAVMDKLPQVLCHNDVNRRNLMLRTTDEGKEEVVALDWAWVGSGAVGLDAGWMTADSLQLFDYDPAQAAELEATVWAAYLAGLREAGWGGDGRLPRLGYLIAESRWLGLLPPWVVIMLGEGSDANTMAMYGRSSDAVLAGWVTLLNFLAERAEEARALMRELKLD